MSNKHAGETRSRRILTMAEVAREFHEPAKRLAVRGLVHERYRHFVNDSDELAECCTEAEILERAYGDPGGREYWKAWLFGPPRLEPSELALLIATHVATSEAQFVQLKTLLQSALMPLDYAATTAAVEWLMANPGGDYFRFSPAGYLTCSSRWMNSRWHASSGHNPPPPV
jgi:hypothetical protein